MTYIFLIYQQEYQASFPKIWGNTQNSGDTGGSAHISRIKFNILKTKNKAMQLICREAKISKIQRMRRGRYLGINKILVTICMNVCNMSPKEACNFHHLFDSLPQEN